MMKIQNIKPFGNVNLRLFLKRKMIQIVCSYLFANRDAVAICIYNLKEVLFFKYKFANSIYP